MPNLVADINSTILIIALTYMFFCAIFINGLFSKPTSHERAFGIVLVIGSIAATIVIHYITYRIVLKNQKTDIKLENPNKKNITKKIIIKLLS